MSFDCENGIIDDWDESFLSRLIQIEEQALSSRNATQPTTIPITNHASRPFNVVPDEIFLPPEQTSQKWVNDCEAIDRPGSFGGNPGFISGNFGNAARASTISISITNHPPQSFNNVPEVTFSPPQELSQKPKSEFFTGQDCEVIDKPGFSGSNQGWNSSSSGNAIQATTVYVPNHAPQSFNNVPDATFSPPHELSQRPKSDTYLTKDCELINKPEFSANVQHGGNRGSSSSNFPNGARGKEKEEIDRLKRELGRVAKKLNVLEHECVELKKDRGKKDEQLKSAFAQLEAKDAEILCLKSTDMNYEASIHDHAEIPQQLDNASTSIGDKGAINTSWARENKSKRSFCNTSNRDHCTRRKNVQIDGLSGASELKHPVLIDNGLTNSNGYSVQGIGFDETTAQPKCSKAVGVQTDLSEACGPFTTKEELSAQDLSNKLLSIWDPPTDKRSGRTLVSKLFMTCNSDFIELFRCISTTTKITLDSLADEIFSDKTLHDHMQSVQSVEAVKVFHLYATVMKTKNEMVQLESLLESLLHLCVLENAVVVHRSLKILHAVLQYVLNFDIRPDKRDNIKVTHSQKSTFPDEKNDDCPKKIISESFDMHHGAQFVMNREETLLPGLLPPSPRHSDVENLSIMESRHSSSTSISLVNWISVFEAMHQIALRNKEEFIRVEAISVMNLILMRSDPNSEREKFGLAPLFESMSQLLLKEVGLHVQKQAVRLLFLLLNCPKLLTRFCNDHIAHIESAGAADDLKVTGGVSGILEGLAECITCRGNGIQELQLRRHAIIVLAFIASSGKSGCEILLDSGSTKRFTFLGLILQALASELDVEAGESTESNDLCKERILLMREALILLNRLASNPVYSSAVLGVLTSSRTMASLTVDVVDRISRKSRSGWRSDKRMQTKEAEIVDLARVFKRKVFSFLGDNIS